MTEEAVALPETQSVPDQVSSIVAALVARRIYFRDGVLSWNGAAPKFTIDAHLGNNTTRKQDLKKLLNDWNVECHPINDGAYSHRMECSIKCDAAEFPLTIVIENALKSALE